MPSDPSSRVARDSLLYCTLAVSRALRAFALIPPSCPPARALSSSLSASLLCIGYKSDYRVSASPPSAPSNLHKSAACWRSFHAIPTGGEFASSPKVNPSTRRTPSVHPVAWSCRSDPPSSSPSLREVICYPRPSLPASAVPPHPSPSSAPVAIRLPLSCEVTRYPRCSLPLVARRRRCTRAWKDLKDRLWFCFWATRFFQTCARTFRYYRGFGRTTHTQAHLSGPRTHPCYAPLPTPI